MPLEGTQSITVLILIGVGSRYENKTQRGISHFLEHMFFKGGQKYKNAKEVASTIDGVGGDFNAFTGKEYTGYYVKLAKRHLDTAFDVLSDMLLQATLNANDIEKERSVILEEYNLYQDVPMYQIGWDFERVLFGDHPLGWDQIGTKERIKNFSRSDFLKYKNKFYTPENTSIIVTGNISEKEGNEKIQHYFEDFFANSTSEKSPKPIDFIFSENPKKIKIQSKKTEQGHLVIGYPGIPFGSEKEFMARTLAIILGGNMSSRMFTHIRDELGLCYSIRTTTDHFSDVGVISTYAGVDINRFDQAIEAICQQYDQIAEKGISQEELDKAKNFMIGKLTLRLEDSEEMASFLGTQTVLTGQVKTEKELFDSIEKITKEDINDLAKNLFTKDKIALSAIGPFGSREEEIKDLLLKK